jgi:hypothetical protein
MELVVFAQIIHVGCVVQNNLQGYLMIRGAKGANYPEFKIYFGQQNFCQFIFKLKFYKLPLI